MLHPLGLIGATRALQGSSDLPILACSHQTIQRFSAAQHWCIVTFADLLATSNVTITASGSCTEIRSDAGSRLLG